MSRQDRATIERIRKALTDCVTAGQTKISTARMLDLLDPDGSWSHGTVWTGHAEPEHQETPSADPRADPLTGCLPVTADGGSAGI